MVTRVLQIELDADAENPSGRRFSRPDLGAWCRDNRAAILFHLCRLAAGGIRAGHAPASRTRFTSWDRLVPGREPSPARRRMACPAPPAASRHKWNRIAAQLSRHRARSGRENLRPLGFSASASSSICKTRVTMSPTGRMSLPSKKHHNQATPEAVFVSAQAAGHRLSPPSCRTPLLPSRTLFCSRAGCPTGRSRALPSRERE